ncbi:MAG: YdiU family protein [Methylophilaceae bacterium]|nr:YdiU family protein [Methylophilaceae bacterium]
MKDTKAQKVTAKAGQQGWNFDNSYARLPASFYEKRQATKVRAPQLVLLNHALAESLGLNAEVLSQEAGAEIFAGNTLPTGAEPLAQAYAGHQFGGFTMLGDGRALLLGEQITPNGERYDIQLKGSGPTAYSRRGDGRAALGPMLREYIISEAMHALGIPTTRSLAVVATGEPVYREETLTGAVLTRVAASHIRVGTFQYAAGIADLDAVQTLADFTIKRHFPELIDKDQPYHALLNAVIDKQADLIAKWMHVGFIHGVMNTDNMTISGETIDYGPCAFMDGYCPVTVFSSIDRQGRYAYGNQPHIALWNLTRFAETLLPLLNKDLEQAIPIAEEMLYGFQLKYQSYWLAGMRAKLGLFEQGTEDFILFSDLLNCMNKHNLDYTNTFRDLATGAIEQSEVWQQADFKDWYTRWQQRLANQSASAADVQKLMLATNPAVIPRNHLVEAALEAATTKGDLQPLEDLLGILATPFKALPEDSIYRQPAPASDRVYQTFCGT